MSRPTRPPAAAGFTFVEVLVALLVLSIGLIGLAGLQSTGLRVNHSAYLRSQATLLAESMADRARANPNGVEDGYYDLAAHSGSGDFTETSVCFSAPGCPAQDLAETDVAQWLEDVEDALPNGEGIICVDSNDPDDGTGSASPDCGDGGDNHVVKVWWTDDRSGDNQRFVTEVRPR